MNGNLHDSAGLPISANEGWQQMHTLLNAHLPVEKPRIKRKFMLQYFSAAAIFMVIFFFKALQLDNGLNNKFDLNGVQASSAVNTGIDTSATTNIVATDLSYNIDGNRSRGASIIKDNLLIGGQDFEPVNRSSTFDPIMVPVEAAQNINASAPEFTGVSQLVQPLIADRKTISNDSATVAVEERKKDRKPTRYFELLAGIGVNTAINKVQNLQPAPIGEIRYHVSKRVFVAAGVTAYSPVTTSTSGLSKTVYLNDTLNNINLYNETTTYKKLRYVDVPISVGINVTKRFSIQMGAQVSVLVNKKQSKELKTYDFQMNTLAMPANLPVFTMRPIPEQNYEVGIRNVDCRFIAGVRYNLKNASIGMMFQQGLQTVGKGNLTDNNKNQVVSLNLLCKLR
jgi:hypothetical protein